MESQACEGTETEGTESAKPLRLLHLVEVLCLGSTIPLWAHRNVSVSFKVRRKIDL